MQSTRERLPLTSLQKDVAGIIAEWWADRGHAPSFAEIKSELDLSSTSQVSFLLDELEKKGWLAPRRKRGIRQLRLTVDRFEMPPELGFAVTHIGHAAVEEFERGEQEAATHG